MSQTVLLTFLIQKNTIYFLNPNKFEIYFVFILLLHLFYMQVNENQRVKEIMDYFVGGSQVKLAAVLEVTQQTLANYVNGKSKIPLFVAEKIKKSYPTVSLEWLVMGTGEMLLSEKSKEYTTTNNSSVVNESSVAYQINSAMSVHITDEQASQLILENNRLKAQLLMVEKLYDKLTDKLAKK